MRSTRVYKSAMTLGVAPKQEDMFQSSRAFCEERLGDASLYRLLAEHGDELFADESFADLFKSVGRRSVAPRIVAAVMVLQRFDGLSDREAVERFTFDVRWKYAAGVSADFPDFVHTVLVDMRERLRRSDRPDRIFESSYELAKKHGLIGKKRVLDSTALYDAVATQDTVTMIRSAIRGLLRALEDDLREPRLRALLRRDDDYKAAGKPICDWDDKDAREALVDALARDAYALLAALDGDTLEGDAKRAAELLAAVTGQDIETTEDGTFRIARRVAKDRIISTVDPDARHGHKTQSRHFDGYKGHLAIDPDSEIITATSVTAGNVGDAAAALDLLKDDLASATPPSATPDEQAPCEQEACDDAQAALIEVYGDASYGKAELVETLENAGCAVEVRVQPPSALSGHFAQDKFTIDLAGGHVTCPNGVLVTLRRKNDGGAEAHFGVACIHCPMRAQCTTSKSGRVVNVHAKHEVLERHRKRHADPETKKRYRSTRPKVERKIAHMMRRKHGGRRARVRGCDRVGRDFSLLGAAVNLARIARLRTAGNVPAVA